MPMLLPKDLSLPAVVESLTLYDVYGALKGCIPSPPPLLPAGSLGGCFSLAWVCPAPTPLH